MNIAQQLNGITNGKKQDKMKKLILSIALILAIGMMANAQRAYITDSTYLEEVEISGYNVILFRKADTIIEIISVNLSNEQTREKKLDSLTEYYSNIFSLMKDENIVVKAENELCAERGHVKTKPYPLSITEDRYLVNVDDYSYWELKKPLEEHYLCGRCGELIVLKTYIRDTVWRKPTIHKIIPNWDILPESDLFNLSDKVFYGIEFVGSGLDETMISFGEPETPITLEDWIEYKEVCYNDSTYKLGWHFDKGIHIFTADDVNFDACKIEDDHIIWRVEKAKNFKKPGRWRDNEFDELIVFNVFGNSAEIKIIGLMGTIQKIIEL